MNDANGIPHAKYSEGLQVGYRWFDSQKIEPLFPFGFGLSYTKFDIRKLRVAAAAGGKTGATVNVDVVNTGSRAGAEVPQLYVGMPKSTGEPPKQLKGYSKVSLDRGASKTATFKLDRRSFSHWNTAAGGWVVTKGCYRIMVGSSSRDIAQQGVVSVGGAKCTGALAQVAAPKSQRCVDTRGFTFKLHHARGARVVKVVVYVNGKRRVVKRGRDIKRVSIKRLPKRRFVVRIVSTWNTGSQLISTRVYNGCKKSRPRTRSRHPQRRD
jgi:hypothetical protein